MFLCHDESRRDRAHKILNSPTNGNAADLTSCNEPVFGRQLVAADLQGPIGDLAGKDRFDASATDMKTS